MILVSRVVLEGVEIVFCEEILQMFGYTILSITPKLFLGNLKGFRAVTYEDLGSTQHRRKYVSMRTFIGKCCVEK